jgi:hypothetical protein
MTKKIWLLAVSLFLATTVFGVNLKALKSDIAKWMDGYATQYQTLGRFNLSYESYGYYKSYVFDSYT